MIVWPVDSPVLWLGVLSVVLISYLLGSIPTGYLVARAKGVDIRKTGSGNIGATNVFRILGKTAGIIVLSSDAIKGACAVLGAPIAARLISGANAGWFPLLAGMSAILGHNYTCWLRFKGGKGIATSAGVMGALVPLALAIVLSIWGLVFGISRYVSLASICAAIALPIATALTTHGDITLTGLTAIIGGLAVWRHKVNIQRLLAGTENRFGKNREGRS